MRVSTNLLVTAELVVRIRVRPAPPRDSHGRCVAATRPSPARSEPPRWRDALAAAVARGDQGTRSMKMIVLK